MQKPNTKYLKCQAVYAEGYGQPEYIRLNPNETAEGIANIGYEWHRENGDEYRNSEFEVVDYPPLRYAWNEILSKERQLYELEEEFNQLKSEYLAQLIQQNDKYQ